MGVGATWFEAAEAAVDDLFDSDAPRLELDSVGEVDLIALGAVLGVPYEPVPLKEGDDGIVLRIPRDFLAALARVDASAAPVWLASAEGLVGDEQEVVELLGAMAAFAREALAGPGVLSIPSFEGV